MARAIRNLSEYPEGLLNMRTQEIIEAVTPCQRALDEDRRLPQFPKLHIHHE
jgi:hypothetical protein